MNRETAPLRQAEDAVLLDTTELSYDESFAALSQLILERFCIQPLTDGAERR
jgi:cytidylate kinase